MVGNNNKSRADFVHWNISRTNH